jgi:hypothetical protein
MIIPGYDSEAGRTVVDIPIVVTEGSIFPLQIGILKADPLTPRRRDREEETEKNRDRTQHLQKGLQINFSHPRIAPTILAADRTVQ